MTTTATKPSPTEFGRTLLSFVAGGINPRTVWHDTLFEAIQAEDATRPALKNWVEEGMEIDTLQVTVQLPNDDHESASISTAWAPGVRILDHVGATFITLNGSRRDFNEVRSVTATRDIFVGIGKVHRDRVDLIVYRVLS